MRISGLCLAFPLLMVGGCATGPLPPSAPVATAPVPDAPRPQLPAGIPERLVVPPRGADGQYRTINSGVNEDRRIWQVRSALNVAVLSCRGADEATLTADYNALLGRQKAVLARAYAGVQAQFRTASGDGWQAAQDAHATRVYNFFALPPAKPGLCATATALLAGSRLVTPQDFPAFAASALPRLEAPFLDVYRAYDRYRRELALWQGTRTDAVLPRLEYVGIDTLIDWLPPAAKR